MNDDFAQAAEIEKCNYEHDIDYPALEVIGLALHPLLIPSMCVYYETVK